ncbi:MAG: hypothetical protein U0X92_01470 [Anaerolineales bacterium]
MAENNDLVNKFIRQAKTQTKITPPVTSRKDRIVTGALIGALTIFTYGIVAETINFLEYPGLPLYFHPFGMIGNIIYAFFGGCLVGIACGWGEKTITSITAGAFVLILGLGISQLLSSDLLLIKFILTVYGLFALPLFAFAYILLVLVMGLIRLAIDLQIEKPQTSWWHWQKTWPIIILLAIAISTGYLRKLPIEWTSSLWTVDRLLQKGMMVQALYDLPEQLREENMGNFLDYASADYKLEVNNSLRVLFYQTDPNLIISFWDNIVIVYFKSGQDIACLANGAEVLKCIPITRKIKLPPLIL